MIISENTFKIDDCIDEVIQKILSSQLFQEYVQQKKAVEEDAEVFRLKIGFISAKEKLEEASRFQDNVQQLRQNMLEKKRALDLNENVILFRQKETALQEKLDEITQKIAGGISKEIKVDAGNPFFKGEHKHRCRKG